MADRITSIVPSDPSWRAVYTTADDNELARVVCWALVEDDDGGRRIVGMVVDPDDPRQIVAAEDGGPAGAFERYGIKSS